MKRRTASIGLLLLFVGLLTAAPPTLKIQPEIKPSGQYVTVSPEGDCTAVTYVGLSNVDPIPAAVLKDPRMFLLDTRGLAVGRYKFAAVGAGKDGEQTRVDFVVVVGDAPVPPPPPPPPPPPIDDPLTKAFQAAYDAETDANKAQLVKSLAAVYDEVPKIAENAAVKTWNELFMLVGKVQERVGTKGKIQGIQKVTQTLLLERFPTDTAKTLSTDDRKLVVDTFKRLAAALGEVK